MGRDGGCMSRDDEEHEETVEIEIGDMIDLHLFAPRDIPAVVRAYLDAAIERGFTEVRLVHGKGKGVQRARVREILAEDPRVVDFFDGPPGRGAWGATVARLRSAPGGPP